MKNFLIFVLLCSSQAFASPSINAGPTITVFDKDKNGTEVVDVHGVVKSDGRHIESYSLYIDEEIHSFGNMESVLTDSLKLEIGNHVVIMEIVDSEGLKSTKRLDIQVMP